MLSHLIVVLAFPLSLTVAGPLLEAGEQMMQLLPANISENEFVGGSNASNELKIECNGQKYGFNPNVPDCQDARTLYKRSAQSFTYGERHSGHGVDVFPLPFRLMGDKALCYIQPVLVDSSLGIGTASINHISNAAYELILQCAVRQSIGGIATGIGGQNMAVVLGTYQPNVQCRGPFSAWKSCRYILGDMPALTRPEIFGPPEDHAVQIPLPQKVESSDGKCLLTIFGRGGRDETSWYKIWEAVTAVYSICTRQGKVGSFQGLGELENLFFILKSQTPQVGNSSTTTVASAEGALSDS
ncbi:hypothetical protein BDR22DRAFT_892841 [Usnea florida]